MVDARNERSDGDPADSQWLAYELHDGLLQWVVSARMHIESLLNQPHKAETVKQLTQTQLFLEQALSEGRELIGFLEAESSSCRTGEFDKWLEQVVEQLQTTTEKNNQHVVLDLCPIPNVPAQVAWNIGRIVQQALNNAIKHSGPGTIAIKVDCSTSNQLGIEIRDNGPGFEIEAANRSGHFGLASMQHRARLIDAELSVESQPGTGTTVRMTLDLDRV